MADEKFVDVSQAALILGVSPTTVRNMVRAKLLPTMSIGVGMARRHRRIPRASLNLVNPLREDGFEEAVALEGGRFDFDGMPVAFHGEATQSTESTESTERTQRTQRTENTEHTQRTESTQAMERRSQPGRIGQPSRRVPSGRAPR